jgi:hypothetical protein
VVQAVEAVVMVAQEGLEEVGIHPAHHHHRVTTVVQRQILVPQILELEAVAVLRGWEQTVLQLPVAMAAQHKHLQLAEQLFIILVGVVAQLTLGELLVLAVERLQLLKKVVVETVLLAPEMV